MMQWLKKLFNRTTYIVEPKVYEYIHGLDTMIVQLPTANERDLQRFMSEFNYCKSKDIPLIVATEVKITIVREFGKKKQDENLNKNQTIPDKVFKVTKKDIKKFKKYMTEAP